jgi:uncharacterized protein
MTTTNRKYLLDVNALVAMADAEHVHFPAMRRWINTERYRDWGVCALTETGFVRVVTNPIMGTHFRTFDQAIEMLTAVASRPGYRFWPMADSWVKLTAPFASRIFGHQQAPDACLLGLAIKEKGTLVTFDNGIQQMAGAEFGENVLVL